MLVENLASYYGKDLRPGVIATYTESLAPYDVALVQRAMEQCAHVETYFPTWALLVRYINSQKVEEMRKEEDAERARIRNSPRTYYPKPEYVKRAAELREKRVQQIVAKGRGEDVEPMAEGDAIRILHNEFAGTCPGRGKCPECYRTESEET